MSIILCDSQIKPPMWAIDPGVVAINASRMGLPMPVGLWVWPGGNWPDLSGNNHTGALINMDSSNLIGDSLLFNGTDEYVDILDKPQLWNTSSLSVVIYVTFIALPDSTKYKVLFGQEDLSYVNSLSIYQNLGTRVLWWLGGNTIYSYPASWPGDNIYHCIIGTWDGTNSRLYVDGDLKNTDTDAPSSIATSLKIAGGVAARYVNCRVKTVSHYDIALIPSQVATLYGSPYGLVQQPKKIFVIPVAVTTTPPTTLAPTTIPPTTAAPTTLAPTTLPPTTAAPTTLPPTTSPPTTAPPTTVAPTTVAPTTIAPTTVAPTTIAPTTAAPTTLPPTTSPPTTSPPTTAPPTTTAPTTVAPTTSPPTTAAPTTPSPTTVAPTTIAPTTSPPTTIAPTTIAPTTSVPTTVAPTTLTLTTLAPTTAPPVLLRRGHNFLGISIRPRWH